jgi:predicted nucleic acid-binding Zn ribbon protein
VPEVTVTSGTGMLNLNSVRMERAGKSLAKLKLSDAISLEQLAVAAWTAAVGKRIASHAQATTLVRGSLIVEAEDAIWQRQLFHLRLPILAKLADVLGGGIISDIEFRLITPRRPPQPAQRLNEPKPSMDEADQIQDSSMRLLYKQARKKASA